MFLGDDPLITVNPREMNSVAGVLKLYFRELKEPLFPRDMFDPFLACMKTSESLFFLMFSVCRIKTLR